MLIHAGLSQRYLLIFIVISSREMCVFFSRRLVFTRIGTIINVMIISSYLCVLIDGGGGGGIVDETCYFMSETRLILSLSSEFTRNKSTHKIKYYNVFCCVRRYIVIFL